MRGLGVPSARDGQPTAPFGDGLGRTPPADLLWAPREPSHQGVSGAGRSPGDSWGNMALETSCNSVLTQGVGCVAASVADGSRTPPRAHS